MIEHLAEILGELPAYLGGHMLLSLAALAVGLATSIPLGIAAVRRPRLGEMMLSIAGVVQTVPSLAFLALMVPLLGGRIGFLPAFLALTLYSILPILSGTIVGIRGVDPAMTEAALGLGMSARQMLFRVQLPLAAPVIVAGIRTSTVLVVGTATLATPVGCTTLGNYIFQGLEMNDQSVIVVGCVLAALLAVAMDQLIRLLELASRHRSRARAWFAAAGLALLTIGGLSRPIGRLVDPPHNPVVVGSGPFTEQHILSEVIKGTLPAAEFTVDQRKGMGESIQFLSLRDGSIDCCVNYTGNVWSTLMKRRDVADRATTLDETSRYPPGAVRRGLPGCARLPERLRPGHAPRHGREVRHPHGGRPRGPRARLDDRGRPPVLRPARMGGGPREIRARVPADPAHGPDPDVRGGLPGLGRRRVGLHQRRADHGVRPRRPGGPETRVPPLRRRAAGLAEGRREARPHRGAAAPGRRHPGGARCGRPTGGSMSNGRRSAAPRESCWIAWITGRRPTPLRSSRDPRSYAREPSLPAPRS